MRRVQRCVRDEAGMSLVFVGMGLMAFLSASMLAVDVGMLMTARNQAQNSADAGALAGATALAFDDFDDRSATGPAVTSAITTGKANDVMGSTVSLSGSYRMNWADYPKADGTPTFDAIQLILHWAF